MIHDLDKSLKKLLEDNLRQTGVQITFESPHLIVTPSSPTIDLFLYDVREGRQLRSGEAWATTRDANQNVLKQASPVPVECSYLITSWSSSEDSQGAIESHRILAEVLRVLLRYPILPVTCLEPSLKPFDLRAACLHELRLGSVSDFWQALGGKPRPALNYTVTLPLPPDAEWYEEERPVTEVAVDVGLRADPVERSLANPERLLRRVRVMGHVKSGASPVAQAVIEVRAKDATTDPPVRAYSGPDGFYFIPDLPTGDYSVTAFAQGFQKVNQDVSVSGMVGKPATLDLALSKNG